MDDPYAYDDYGYDYSPPVCDWGYYNYYPYDCAPYGYYGPQWFSGGIFLGVGPWYGWGWNHGCDGGSSAAAGKEKSTAGSPLAPSYPRRAQEPTPLPEARLH